jgi:hypothetical protein
MRVNPFLMPIILVVALFGTVLVAQAAGVWATSGKTAINMEKMAPADLKGWMTLQQVMDGLKISQEELYAAGKIPADVPLTTALKDLEKIVPGFETSTLRDVLVKPTAPAAVATVMPTPATAPAAEATATHATPTPLPPGQVLPADQIKGRMTLREVSQQCAVPLDKIIAGLKLPADTNPDTTIKDLIAQGKLIEVTDVQKVVATLQK